jgi:hypothetical protein
MESNFRKYDEFEQFLQDEVKNHRMYPSEQVWDKIRSELHGKGSWKALTFIAIFIILSLSITTIYNYPPKNIFTKTYTPISIANLNSVKSEVVTDEKSTLLEQSINPSTLTNKTINKINQNLYATSYSENHATALHQLKKEEDKNMIVSANSFNHTLQNVSIISKHINASNDLPELIPTESFKNNSYPSGNTQTMAGTGFVLYPNFNLLNQKNREVGYKKSITTAAYNNSKHINNEWKLSKFSYQLYITPSISYRNLEDNQERLNYAQLSTFALNSPINTNNLVNSNVNAVVHHKPALGMEAGGAILYRLNKNLQIKTGLQFNIRQYYIDAYWAPFNIATIAYVRNHQLDSVNMLSAYSNTSGYQNAKLDNKLYQISMPIGLQWSFLPNSKIGVDAGITFQPTLTLNKNVYLLSTDYKYYTNGASFFRKWNANTGVDLNITYKTANRTWFIGPQIRYQHFPTYNDLYPIKEFRWDYGIKVGFTQPIR